MNEQDDIFENLFKVNLQNIELPVSEGLLSRIKKTIFKRKKRKLFFWLILFLGFGSIVISFFFNTITKNRNISNKNFVTNVITTNSKANENTIYITDTMYDKSQQSRTFTTVPKNNDIKQQKKKNKIISFSNKKTDENNLSKKILNKHISKTPVLNKSVKATPENKLASTSTKSIKNKSQNITKSGSKNKSEQDPELVKNKAKKSTITHDSAYYLNDTAITINMTIRASVDSIKTETSILKKDSLKVLATESITSTSISTGEVKEDSIKNKTKFFIGLESGAILNFKKYSEINTTLNENKISKYNFGYNSLLNFGFVKKRLGFESGIGFSSIKSNYEYSILDTVHETITLYDFFGNPYPYDSTYMASKSVPINFNYSYFNLPVFIEYELLHTNKINIKPSLGAQLNYLYSLQASILDTLTKETINYNTANFKSITIALTGGLKIEYQLSQNWTLYLNPSYFMYLNTILDDRSKKINPKAINLNFGVRYYFK